jgi:hypothetical protein
MTIKKQIKLLKEVQLEHWNDIEDEINQLKVDNNIDIYNYLCKYTNKWVKLFLYDGTVQIVKYENVGSEELECTLVNTNIYNISFALYELSEISQVLPLDELEVKRLKEQTTIAMTNNLNKLFG